MTVTDTPSVYEVVASTGALTYRLTAPLTVFVNVENGALDADVPRAGRDTRVCPQPATFRQHTGLRCHCPSQAVSAVRSAVGLVLSLPMPRRASEMG